MTMNVLASRVSSVSGVCTLSITLTGEDEYNISELSSLDRPVAGCSTACPRRFRPWPRPDRPVRRRGAGPGRRRRRARTAEPSKRGIFCDKAALSYRGIPMTSLSSRSLLPVGLVVQVVAGCSHASGTRQTSPPGPATVTSEDIERNPGQPIEKVLQGRFSGVEVSRTADGGIAVRIRGASSFNASTQPLYVVDGIPMQPGPNGSLTGINPYDIESIQVLKDVGDTAIYGMRGANGVIVIKTKRPGRR